MVVCTTRCIAAQAEKVALAHTSHIYMVYVGRPVVVTATTTTAQLMRLRTVSEVLRSMSFGTNRVTSQQTPAREREPSGVFPTRGIVYRHI